MSQVRQAFDYLLAIRDLVMGMSPFATNVTYLVVASMLLLLVLGLYNPRILLYVSLGLYTGKLMNVDVFPAASVDLSVPALGVAIIFAIYRGRLPRFAILRGGIFPAAFVYATLGLALMPAADDPGLSVEVLVALTVAVLFAWVVLSAATGEEIRTALCWVMGTVTIVSIILSVGGHSDAILGGRWRGLTSNANTLGIVAGLFLLTTGTRRGQRFSLVAVIAVLLGTASRASAFGVGLVAGPRIIERQTKVVRRVAGGLAVLAAIPLLHAVFFAGGQTSEDGSGLTRTRNSRSDFWEEGLDLVRENPLTGVGLGNQPGLISSSVISPMAELGLPALLPLAMVAAVGLRILRSKEVRFRAVFLFLLVNGIFESWLFAGGSMFFVTFLLSAYLATAGEQAVAARASPPSAASRRQPEPLVAGTG